MRALRTLNPVRLRDTRTEGGNHRLGVAAFSVALFGVIVEYVLSGNSLADLGIDYSSPGGNPAVKLHPATYLIMLATAMALLFVRPAGAGVVRLFRQKPALASYITLVLFCAFYSIANVGISGAAVYVESYLAAGLLAVVLEGGTDRQKRTLAWWIIGLTVLSVFISIWESITQTHLIPLNFGDLPEKAMQQDVEEFRGAGLFTHPLTAALADSMAVFLLLRMRMHGLLKAALFTILVIGLLSFGGRAAMGTTLLLLVGASFVVLVRGIVRRDLSLSFVGTLIAALLILPPLIILLVTSTDIGERIITHLYADESVKARDLQWLVLNHLNMKDVLFGVPMQRLDVLKYQIGLGAETTDIENFWLLMFLNLGIIGFMVFLVALGLFLAHLGRTVRHPLGWMMIFASILIDSTSNSLGRKSPDLVFMTACLIAMTGYAHAASPVLSLRQRANAGVQRASRRLRLSPSPVNIAGLKP
ncbi:MAG TPA: VpsF family polysaccharide biosynthesis protein [Rhodopila sp.]|nr:VpsF family polysaccharide biosynthesis protein [Rhodopila sp.]